MIHHTVFVRPGQQQYPIYIGQQLFSDPKILRSHITGHQVMIVTQQSIAQTYLPALQNSLQDYQCDVLMLPEGEAHKNLEQWQKILNALLQQGHERSTTLIALGGGLVGDITGFAAACYQRGVNFIQVPTTLIAQVDAAIGGKTAVNHAHGKNLIGAFYQPRCVISDIDVLQSLPAREYVAGLSEVIKYGLIRSPQFFTWLEENIAALLARESSALLHAVQVCSQIKAEIVSEDEKEQGVRSLLNLGHTFAHALETAGDYQTLLHGEAVAMGLAMASVLSADLAWLSATEKERILTLLHAAGLMSKTIAFPCVADFVALMQRDKKVHQGKCHLILLKGIGQAVKTSDVSEQQVVRVLEKFLQTKQTEKNAGR